MTLYRRGDKGEEVKRIQRALNLLPDGVFGTLTEERVREFQRENGIKADGIVGPATLIKLLPAIWKKSKRTITEIIVHCTDTPEGREVTVEDVRRWHRQQGWTDIGYHYFIGLDGKVHEGRSIDIAGAHCQGHNSHSIGVAYAGGRAATGKAPKDPRTPAQKEALALLLLGLCYIYKGAKIYGHRDFAAKACPSFDARAEYKKYENGFS